jgi:hypothetical protein
MKIISIVILSEINKFSEACSNVYVSHPTNKELWGMGGEAAQ